MTATLTDWLHTLRARGITATATDGVVHLDGPATDLDRAWLDRHHDALLVAAAGTHPAWWAAVRDPTRWHDDLTLPAWPDLSCAVRDCPGQLGHYSPDGLPYCAGHHPELWHAPLPETPEAAA